MKITAKQIIKNMNKPLKTDASSIADYLWGTYSPQEVVCIVTELLSYLIGQQNIGDQDLIEIQKVALDRIFV